VTCALLADVVVEAPPPQNAPAPSVAPERERIAPNAVFVELLGNGLVYSINYERFLCRWPIGLRAGASFFTYKVSDAKGSGNLTLATFPFVASYYVGSTSHKLQLGLGATVIYLAASTDATGTKYEGPGAGLGLAATAVVGYRYVPMGRGITFGAGFTPLVRPSKGFLPWGGVDVGYAF
jgi:hypothetical protein